MALSDKTEQHLAELRRREEEELAEVLSSKYGLSYRDLTRSSINSDALRLITEADARKAEVAAFDIVGKKISLAMRSPNHPELPPVLQDLKEHGYETAGFMVSRASLERAWERYKDLSFAMKSKEGALDISSEELGATMAKIKTVDDIKNSIAEVATLKKAYRISKILEVVLAGAFAVDASDIHIETEAENVRMRYRLDGVLHDIMTIDHETHGLLMSRLKLLSGLKLNVRDAAQDGRFSVELSGKETEIRTSVIPGAYGETVVMRLLDPAAISVPFEGLGMEPALKALVEREIKSPNGMLLNTGPTGSGKTTTLYACLKKVHSPEIKIITIEDPIEYHVQGVVQTQVEKNYSWLDGLRSALRQDPDIIMIGEIRDIEVARTAVDAALTGHFVFSTLHTNAAAGTFPRLSDLGIDPKVFSSAISVAMAQRLVRVLCASCKKKVPLEGKNKEIAEKIVGGLRNKSVVPAEAGFLYEPVGCEACNKTGYKGRIGIFEAIVMDDELDELLRTSPSEREIYALQKKREFMTLAEDGVVKALNGVTSWDELIRVVSVEEN
ncbi:type II/IV secretion system protein [Patescibacteria group bacterium]|nr:type II/IV secretion system protein [Patescibacteria group bacterium]